MIRKLETFSFLNNDIIIISSRGNIIVTWQIGINYSWILRGRCIFNIIYNECFLENKTKYFQYIAISVRLNRLYYFDFDYEIS